MKRIFAWIGILAIALGFVLLVYFTATGASANVIMGTLFSMFAVSFVSYGFLMYLRWKNKNTNDEESN